MVKKTSVSRVKHAVRSIAQVNGKPHLGKPFPLLLSCHLSPWSYRAGGYSGPRPRETDCTPGPSPPWQLGVTISKYVSVLLVSSGTFLSPWPCWQPLTWPCYCWHLHYASHTTGWGHRKPSGHCSKSGCRGAVTQLKPAQLPERLHGPV